MKHFSALAALALGATAALGEAPGSPSAQAPRGSASPVPPSRLAEWTARTGGMVEQVPNGKSILIVDARRDKALGFAPLAKTAQAMLHLPFEVKEVECRAVSSPYAAAAPFRDEMHPAVMFVFDAAGLPTLSIYPEDAIGCLNVHALADGDGAAVRQRLLREFWRLAGFTLGGYAQGGLGCVMQPVFSVGDLDEVRGSSLNPLQFNGIFNASLKLDLRSDRPVPYSAACKMGWAPPPTNDAQRAIYERFRNKRLDARDPTARWKRDFPDKAGRK